MKLTVLMVIKLSKRYLNADFELLTMILFAGCCNKEKTDTSLRGICLFHYTIDLSENTIQPCFQCPVLSERQCITLAQMMFLDQFAALKTENEV